MRRSDSRQRPVAPIFSANAPINNLCVFGQRVEDTIPNYVNPGTDVGRAEIGYPARGAMQRFHQGPFVRSQYFNNQFAGMMNPFAQTAWMPQPASTAAADQMERTMVGNIETDSLDRRYPLNSGRVSRFAGMFPDYGETYSGAPGIFEGFSSHDAAAMMQVERDIAGRVWSSSRATTAGGAATDTFRHKEMLEPIGDCPDNGQSYTPGGCCLRTRRRPHVNIRNALRNYEFEDRAA